MSPHLPWTDIALRIGLAIVASGLIGLNRSEHGHAAGMRTTMLVCLAATIAMIETNLLLDTYSEAPASYVRMDVMRLPLGILSGIGFIGAGAILRRGGLMLGVTTAATMWFVTVMGLCFGAGQLGLGGTTFGIGMVVLGALKFLDRRIRHERRSRLTMVTRASGPPPPETRRLLAAAGFRISSEAVAWERAVDRRTTRWELQRAEEAEHAPPMELLEELSTHAATIEVRWEPGMVDD
ncbi:MAG TPA: MgtC/SapB family protein [Opitutus sp.]|nr:MgtC/SapB family protein [Opitutus sp.]